MEDDLDLGGGEAAPDPLDVPEDDPQPQEPEPPFVDLSDGPEEQRLGGENQADEEPQEPIGPGVEDEPPLSQEDVDDRWGEGVAKLQPEDGGVPDDSVGTVPPEPEPEPEPEPKPNGKGKSPVRDYFVLEATGEEDVWRYRTTVVAHNPEGAMRSAYRVLYADSPESATTFVVVPQSMWQPRRIRGRQPKQTVAIDIE